MNQTSLTVFELTRYIQSILEEEFQFVRVVGEISNWKEHSSGHRYFSLKDNQAVIGAVMWKTRPLPFAIKEGMKVTVTGRITLYPPQGKYQLDCFTLIPAGDGDLFIAFEQLKQELSQLGYFERNIKKSIPNLPMKIGISTSKTGAALQDMLSTLQRRNPLAEIIFRPTIVQGSDSAKDIVHAIKELNSAKVDVIIIGRGGGSMEDLWSYNTRIVAEAIFNCKVPVVSAVGHETDFTIADFVADVRAATPTAAAELVSPLPLEQLYQHVLQREQFLTDTVTFKMEDVTEYIENLFSTSMIFRIQSTLALHSKRADDLTSKLSSSIRFRFDDAKKTAMHLNSILQTLHPQKPLERGFALIKKNNSIVSVNHNLQLNDEITITRLYQISNAKIQ